MVRPSELYDHKSYSSGIFHVVDVTLLQHCVALVLLEALKIPEIQVGPTFDLLELLEFSEPLAATPNFGL